MPIIRDPYVICQHIAARQPTKYKYMKKNIPSYFQQGKWKKTLFLMRLSMLAMICSMGTLAASPVSSPHPQQQSQQARFDVSYSKIPLGRVLSDLRTRSGYDILYYKGDVPETNLVTYTKKGVTLSDVLNVILPPNGLAYTIKAKTVTITKATAKKQVMESSTVSVKGRVVDTKGVPLVGVNVVVYGTQNGTITNADGRYTIEVDPEGVLSASYIGFKTEIIPVKGSNTVNFTLESSSQQIEEVAVVAFGTQKKESVVSAITTVRPMDLKTSSSDFTSGLAGRVAGIVGWQTGGLPGALTEEEMNTKFYIRGITSFNSSANIEPLILIDGVESSKLDLSRMATEDIETFSVMKDASATAMYGARGANGVILITTKKGEEGSVYTTVRYELVMNEPTREIDVVDPITYMGLYNEASLGRSQAATPTFSKERIKRTASGKYPSWVYPANDWYKQLFKDHSLTHHAGVSIRGGSSTVQYFASVNFNRDEGMLKSDKLNDFDVNIVNNQTSFRTNLNIDLKAGIKLLINSSATLDKYNGPIVSQTEAYRMAFKASPVDFAPLYPGDEKYSWPHLRFGTTIYGKANPYMEQQKGYLQRTRYSTTNRAEYIHNLSSLIDGLEVRASASLRQSGYYSTGFSTSPYKYALDNYDFQTGKHTLIAIDPTNSYRTLKVSNASAAQTETQVTYEGRLLHTAAWKDHQTSLTAVFQMQEQTSTPIREVLEGMPKRNLTYSMRGTYGFKDRYFGEFSFGYNGSERFEEHNRFGFFPAGGLAWVLSSEPFMRNSSKWLSFAKLRASYGKVGNDGVIAKPRFVYLPNIIEGGNVTDPLLGQSENFRPYVVMSYANPTIQWEIAEQFNLGLEAKFFGGLVEVNLDAYQEYRHNIISQRLTIPSNIGIANPPLANIGKVRSRGVDFAGKIQHSFTNDFWVILNGTITYNKAIYQELDEPTDRPAWQRRIGHEISKSIGYIAEGLFKDQAEIDNAPLQNGNVQPGDIRYRDLNNDGRIDQFDATFIGFPETPRLIYGFSGFINYKNFELNFAFQGSGKRAFFMDPVKMSPFAGDNAVLKAIYDDHWTEKNMSNKPFWPRLSTSRIDTHNAEENWGESKTDQYKSTYFMREASFLRCTNLEFAYNLPRKLLRSWGLQNVKVSVKANNLFSISNFKVWDVELGGDGFNYPIQRTYSVGLNVSF